MEKENALMQVNNPNYLFTIDYSAQNGFGGLNRDYYWITVNAKTGRVTLAFNSN